jgi:hypothetical protein
MMKSFMTFAAAVACGLLVLTSSAMANGQPQTHCAKHSQPKCKHNDCKHNGGNHDGKGHGDCNHHPMPPVCPPYQPPFKPPFTPFPPGSVGGTVINPGPFKPLKPIWTNPNFPGLNKPIVTVTPKPGKGSSGLGGAINGLENTAGKVITGAEKTVGSVLTGAERTAGQIAGGAVKTVGQVAGGAVKAVGSVLGGAEKAAGSVISGAEDAVSSVVGAIGDLF